MRFRNCLAIFSAISFLSARLVGQQGTPPTAARDPQALSVLERSLNAAGGTDSLGKIRDYVASGKIVYYWAGEEVEGHVILQGRGIGQFRLEANLPRGVRSWAINNGTGALKETDGQKTPIPSHNTINFGNLTFPSMTLLNVLRDPSISVTYLGPETREAGPAHHIRSRKTFDFDPNGVRSKLTTRDFWIDFATLHVIQILDSVHPKDNSIEEYPHEVQFSDYRAVSGMIVPFSIVELYSGQRVSAIDLTEVTFDHGLQDADFVLN